MKRSKKNKDTPLLPQEFSQEMSYAKLVKVYLRARRLVDSMNTEDMDYSTFRLFEECEEVRLYMKGIR